MNEKDPLRNANYYGLFATPERASMALRLASYVIWPDEHGLPLLQAAGKSGVTVREYLYARLLLRSGLYERSEINADP
ncbi:MAG: hypothetical protein HY514_04640 [Candidatus Aenigmarchaeota archaeon]|nr:hypothetical protein [Candidatus Aenigmarchaeota archaeon]